jgi:hypothetical protein
MALDIQFRARLARILPRKQKYGEPDWDWDRLNEECYDKKEGKSPGIKQGT